MLFRSKLLTTDEILEKYYDKLLFVDYEYQKKFFYDAYKELYTLRPDVKKSYYCANRQKTKIEIIQREKLPFYNIYLEQNKILFFKIYLKILNIEYSYKYDPVELENIFIEIKRKFARTLDEKEVLLYIFSQFETVTL